MATWVFVTVILNIVASFVYYVASRHGEKQLYMSLAIWHLLIATSISVSLGV